MAWGDRVFRTASLAAAAVVVATFAATLWMLVQGSWPAWQTSGLAFLTRGIWNTEAQDFGARFALYGTLASSALALVIAVPVAIGTAVALAFLLPRWLAAPLGVLVELLAAIPSIVFGIWGAAVIVPLVRGSTHTLGPSLLSAGIVLALMVLPIITAVSRDMVRAVPGTIRDAALALGLTPWEVTWKVVLPHARSGLLAATLLGLARALGETMAVIYVVGNSHQAGTLLQPGETLASLVATEFPERTGALHGPALLGLALILVALSLATGLVGRAVARRKGGTA